MRTLHRESHVIHRVGWLRAAVLGANDGIVSTASLVIGVAAANGTHQSILITAIAGLAAGSMAMATGEYVSVSSQADAETAALAQEKAEIGADYASELRELTGIYVQRGLDQPLAKQVAEKLMAKDALGTHAREELGIAEHNQANPLQAALFSAASFATGAAMPLMVVWLAPVNALIMPIAVTTLIGLGVLGALAAKAGGAPVMPSLLRITFWSSLAMVVTAGIGRVFGVSV
jgi:vacuolar iron transporter family protein